VYRFTVVFFNENFEHSFAPPGPWNVASRLGGLPPVVGIIPNFLSKFNKKITLFRPKTHDAGRKTRYELGVDKKAGGKVHRQNALAFLLGRI
jgi:hypothetical protein